jgi:purine-binding chemotaxis protein CheW
VGRSVRFTIDVSNRGTAPIGQSLLVNTLPEELEFLWASDVGEFDPSDRSITWILGTLEPGHSRAFIVEVTPKTPGEHPHHTLAWTDCGLEAHADSALDAQIDQSLSSRLLDQLLAAVDEEDKEATSQTQAEIRPNVVSPAPGARGSQYVVFSMSDGDYAIPLENVLEYGHPLKVTPVPNVPEWVLGVANVHGDIVSMVDLRLFLGQDPHGFDEDGRLLVVRSRKEDITVGLIVDRVKGIHVVADEHILQPSSRAEDHLATYVRGVASHHGRLIVLLSLDQLLLSSEMRQFEPV